MKEFPSPQVGSEPYHLPSARFWNSKFPSPQVGSELYGHKLIDLLKDISLPSSRNPTVKARHGTGSQDFHPLKSGRNLELPVEVAMEIVISIPSSRVGTMLRVHNGADVRGFPSPQVGSEPKRAPRKRGIPSNFHPLKSGRNGLPRAQF